MSPEAAGRVEAVLRLPADASSAGEVRWFVRSLLRHWALDADSEVVTLLASELATNALRHAGSAFELGLRRSPEGLRVSVADCSPAHPVTRRPGPEAESGRGLLLVEELAQRWGVDDGHSGKCVWFEVAAG